MAEWSIGESRSCGLAARSILFDAIAPSADAQQEASMTLENFIVMLDLGGTFVFAMSGAVAGVNRRLDIFGLLVLAFVAGNAGGVTRDILIGAVPPAALSDERYLLASVLAGLLIF